MIHQRVSESVADDPEDGCFKHLIGDLEREQSMKNQSKWPKQQQQQHQQRHFKMATSYYSTIVKRIRYNRHFIAFPSVPSRANFSFMLMLIALSSLLVLHTLAPISVLDAAASPVAASAVSESNAAGEEVDGQQSEQQQQRQLLKQEKPQARVGGLDPSDYIDEAGELEIMAHQQQIPTAQLMAAAGHSIPENYFLPGGSIPALYALRYQQNLLHHQQQQQFQQQQRQEQQQQQQQQQVDPMQQVASHHVQARHVSPGKFSIRQTDLIAAATALAEQHQQQQDLPSLVDYNGYNLVSGSTGSELREPQAGASAAAGPQSAGGVSGAAVSSGGAVDLVDFLNPTSQQALYEQQQQQQQYAIEQQLVAELAALQRQQQDYQAMDQQMQASENSLQDQSAAYAQSLGPSYQVEAASSNQGSYESGQMQKQRGRPFGLPTKSSNKEPSDMLKPLGNPKTISSPAIDFVTNQLPKTSQLEKLAEKVPPAQVPTVFSFSSSKDPSEKVKAVNQKKRNVMRQAEQMAKSVIKSVNDKFGTNIGDQTDLPFLLTSLTPLGMAQQFLSDPTLFVTLLNTIEKTYLSDVLPGPAKAAIRPILNIFRMPNKKRDKANLSNIISFLASGMQAPSPGQVKHRQGTGVEKASKNKSNR